MQWLHIGSHIAILNKGNVMDSWDQAYHNQDDIEYQSNLITKKEIIELFTKSRHEVRRQRNQSAEVNEHQAMACVPIFYEIANGGKYSGYNKEKVYHG